MLDGANGELELSYLKPPVSCLESEVDIILKECVAIMKDCTAGYVGVTRDIVWRFYKCDSNYHTNMRSHYFEMGMTHIFPLRCNTGSGSCWLEERVIARLLDDEECAPKMRNSPRYTSGPINEYFVYKLYLTVRKP